MAISVEYRVKISTPLVLRYSQVTQLFTSTPILGLEGLGDRHRERGRKSIILCRSSTRFGER